MLLVRVDNGKNTLLMELPCKRMLMAEHLASIAITAPASEVKCIDEENAPIKVKILGVSDFAGKLASLISPEDSLSLVNTACEMYQTLPYQNKLEAQAAVLNDQVDTVRDFLRYMMEHRMEDTIDGEQQEAERRNALQYPVLYEPHPADQGQFCGRHR